MQINLEARELTLKIVYYGPALSGKTSNISALNRASNDDSAGRLITLETKDDRTLLYDLLPLTYKDTGNFTVRVKVFTVPGQVLHASTRKLQLQGADGLVFVADSQVRETQHNADAFLELREFLKSNGLNLSEMPLVIQFNKRDLPEIRSDSEIHQTSSHGQEPVFMSTANNGAGVVETFLGCLYLTMGAIEKTHGLKEKFGLDRVRFVEDTARRLGMARPLAQIFDECVSGAFNTLTPGDLER